MTGEVAFELSDPRPALEVRQGEYRRLLGFPLDHEPTERARELGDAARAWYVEHGRPWWYARHEHRVALTADGVRIGPATFAAPRLRELMRDARADAAVLVAVSAGRECEAEGRRLWEDEKPDEYFFLVTFGSAVVEALVAAVSYRLCEWADRCGLAVLPHYSPGYPGWGIEDQRELLDLVHAGRRIDMPGEMHTLDTGMLAPRNSLLAVFGVTRHVERVRRLASLVPCENCSLGGCRYRRAAYRRPLPRIARG